MAAGFYSAFYCGPVTLYLAGYRTYLSGCLAGAESQNQALAACLKNRLDKMSRFKRENPRSTSGFSLPEERKKRVNCRFSGFFMKCEEPAPEGCQR
jgi:hypothetical protein